MTIHRRTASKAYETADPEVYLQDELLACQLSLLRNSFDTRTRALYAMSVVPVDGTLDGLDCSDRWEREIGLFSMSVRARRTTKY